MDSPATYLLANRLWWSVALLAGPIAGAIAGEAIVGIAVIWLLVLLALVVFDADRSWWSDEVRRLPQDPDLTRAETRRLTLWSGVALLAGLVIAASRPWGSRRSR
jgi:hypothetical protein